MLEQPVKTVEVLYEKGHVYLIVGESLEKGNGYILSIDQLTDLEMACHVVKEKIMDSLK